MEASVCQPARAGSPLTRVSVCQESWTTADCRRATQWGHRPHSHGQGGVISAVLEPPTVLTSGQGNSKTQAAVNEKAKPAVRYLSSSPPARSWHRWCLRSTGCREGGCCVGTIPVSPRTGPPAACPIPKRQLVSLKDHEGRVPLKAASTPCPANGQSNSRHHLWPLSTLSMLFSEPACIHSV